jgi:hypothetical protein
MIEKLPIYKFRHFGNVKILSTILAPAIKFIKNNNNNLIATQNAQTYLNTLSGKSLKDLQMMTVE